MCEYLPEQVIMEKILKNYRLLTWDVHWMGKTKRRLVGRQWKNSRPTMACGERTKAGQNPPMF